MGTIKYKALLETIHCGSLSKAAENLGYTQPGISHMIRSLEEEFGFSLLVRKKEGVIPTAAANEIIHYINQIVVNEENLKNNVNKIKGTEIGTIRIGAFYTIMVSWMPEIISHFEKEYPSIKLSLFEGDREELLNWLEQDRIDIGMLSLPVPEGFDFIPLKNDPVYAVMHKDHKLSKKDHIKPAELMDSPFIIPFSKSDEDVWRVLDAQNLKPTVKYQVKGCEAILSMVSKKLGVSILPALLLERMPENTIYKKFHKEYTRTLGIAVRSEKYASPAAKQFIKMTRSIII